MKMKWLVAALFVLGTVTPAMADPPLLRLYYYLPNNVDVHWTLYPGAAAYQVRRTSSYPNWDFTFNAPGYASSFAQYVTPGTMYIYQVVPLDGNLNPMGPASNPGFVYAAISFTDDPIAATVTPVRASHVTQLRTYMNTVRAAAGMTAFTWTNPSLATGSTIAGADFQNLRDAFSTAYVNAGGAAPAWDDPSLPGVLIKAIHMQQLRTRLRSYPNYITPYSNTETVSNRYFSPNGDGVKDTSTYSASFFNATAQSRLRIDVRRVATGAVVRSATATGSSVSFTWDGRDGGGVVQPEGDYNFEVVDLDSVNAPLTSKPVTIDLTPPTASIASPAAGATVSNIRQNGSGDVAVTGTVTDAFSLATWKVERTGNNQATVTINSGTSPVAAGGSLGTWATIVSGDSIPNGVYTLKLTATDAAGNTSTATNNVTVANFSASLAGHEINTTTSQTVTYTSVVPLTVIETITLRNAANTDVRTLFSGTRTPQTYTDTWDGRDAGGQPMADGPYRFIVTVTDGTYTMTWDKSNEAVPGGFTQYPYPTCRNASGAQVACNDSSLVFDPYLNKPLRINYCVTTGDVATGCSGSGPVVIVAKASFYNEDNSTCSPSSCIGTWYEASGAHEIVWYGTNSLGQYVADTAGGRLLVLRGTNYPKNLVLLFGTKPVLDVLSITPVIYNPGAGSQTFTVTTTSALGRTIALTAKFRNTASGSVLRTITTAAAAGGTRTVTWDGRADNGMWVAPGLYEVEIDAVDSVGSTAVIKPLVTVRY